MKTIFLDRDGVINEDTGYPCSWKNFKIIDGVVEALELLIRNDYNLIIVTNQSGIARNLFTEADYHNLMKQFIKYFSEKKIIFKDILYCPHHPNGIIKKYTKQCNCRKPSSGLIDLAKKRYNIDVNNSYMIGDKISDVQAGLEANIKNNFLIQPKRYEKSHNFKVFKNLLKCAEYIVFRDTKENVL